MNIIVVGCGKIGLTILSNLVAEGHNVMAVDTNPDVIEETNNIYDVMGVCSNGADCETLEEAGVSKADLVVACTDSDEVNMLSCYIAKRMGAKYTMARIRNPEYNDNSLIFMRSQLDISVAINPELLAARELFNILKLPSAAKIETFSGRSFEIIEFKLRADSLLDGVKIADLRNKFKAKVLICAVQRGDEAYIPDGEFVLKSGDRIGLSANHTEITKFIKELGIGQKKARNIMILGGGRIAYYLAKMLINAGISTTIIERDREVCEELCEALPKAVIVNGDGAEQEILLEEGLLSVDAFVSLTGMDEENILVSAFAQSKNVPKVVTKVNREELIPLADHWGLDCIVTPKKMVADSVVKYARALENSAGSSMETLYKIMDNKVEALEFKVKPDFPKLKVSFKELKLKKNVLIAGIMRDRESIIPAGDDMLLAGDRVIILAANQRINTLSDILK
ncbi:MAG: Trk system potassium transporter TrkA [Clostridia bacterium]|nr:Trk system potassium transporter TrkA [Clostridia bacterium]